MTIPIIPTAAFQLAQGIGRGLQAYGEARQGAQDRTRQQDLQNIALWAQLLPSLAQYNAPVGPQMGFTGGAPLLAGAPEQFATPTPPAPISQSLQRVTGQSRLGLSPGQQSEMRKGALEAQTFGAEAAAPGLRNKIAEQSLARGAIGLQKDQYDLTTAPARDAAAYSMMLAPTYVNAALATGLQPTEKNRQKIIDQAYAAFVQNDTSGWKDRIGKDLFAKAVGDEIDAAEKMGLAQYNAATARIGAQAQNDPWKYLQMGADNYGATLTRMQMERARLLAPVPGAELGLSMPQFAETKAKIEAIDKAMPAIQERQQNIQNMLDKHFGGLAPMGEQAPGPQAPGSQAPGPQVAPGVPAPQTSTKLDESSFDQGLELLGSKWAAIAQINNAVSKGMIEVDVADRLRTKYQKKPTSWTPGR